MKQAIRYNLTSISKEQGKLAREIPAFVQNFRISEKSTGQWSAPGPGRHLRLKTVKDSTLLRNYESMCVTNPPSGESKPTKDIFPEFLPESLRVCQVLVVSSVAPELT